MAKGKRTVALFEVINKDRRFERKAPAAPPPPPKPAPVPSQDYSAQVADLRRRQKEIDSPPGFFSTLIPKIKSTWNAARTNSITAAHFAKNWANQQFGQLAGAAAAFVMIGAVLAARHWIHVAPSEAQSADILQALRNGPAHPSVLVGPGDKPGHSDAALSPELAADVMQANGNQPDAAAPIEPAHVESAAPTNIAQPGERIVNMEYVLIQSYFEEKTAKEACGFLNDNGIACTIERGVKGWRKDFYQVIGLQGFARPSGSEYAAYRQRLTELSARFSPKNPRGYRHFQPQAIKW